MKPPNNIDISDESRYFRCIYYPSLLQIVAKLDLLSKSADCAYSIFKDPRLSVRDLY